MTSPSSTSPTIRFATEEDVPTILALIHELAAYERATSSVLATEQTLLVFTPTTTATASGHVPSASPSPQKCAGMALYFTNYSTWRAAPGIYLEDLFVRPKYRGKGYGTFLLQELARETRRIGGERLEWSVLKWNEPSIKFYEGIGARRMEEWMGMRVDDQALVEMAGVK